MKIEINLKIFLIIILCLMFKNISTYLIFLIFIFIHEMSHMIFGIMIGGKPQKIIVEPYGISLILLFPQNNSHLLKIAFYLIGPIINLICAFIFVKYSLVNDTILRDKIIYTNLLLFVFNLLPIYPLDGGKVLNEIFSSKIVLFVSKFFLAILTFLYSIFIIKIKNIYIFFLIIYLWYLYYVEEKKLSLYEKTIKIVENLK